MSKSLAKHARQEIEDVLEGAMKDLKHAARDLGDDVDAAISHAAKRLLNSTEAFANKAAPTVEDFIERAAPVVRETFAKAEGELRRRPIAASVSALAAAAALLHLLIAARRPAS